MTKIISANNVLWRTLNLCSARVIGKVGMQNLDWTREDWVWEVTREVRANYVKNQLGKSATGNFSQREQYHFRAAFPEWACHCPTTLSYLQLLL